MVGVAFSELLILVVFGGFGIPLGMPPAAEDPLMAKVAPEKCLYYTTWAGVAKPNGKSRNQVEQLFAEPEVQQLIERLNALITQGLGQQAAAEQNPQAKWTLENGVKLAKILLLNAGTIFIEEVQVGPAGPDVRGAAMFHLGENQAEVKAMLEEFRRLMLRDKATSVELAGVKFDQFQPGPGAPTVTWGLRGKYLMIGVGAKSIEGLLERARQEPPKWLVAAQKQIPIARRSTLARIDVQGILRSVPGTDAAQVQNLLKAIGVQNLTAITSSTGLDETAAVSRTIVSLDGASQGLFTAVDGRPLAKDDLAGIPEDASFSAVVRLDAEKLFGSIEEVMRLNPRASASFQQTLQQMEAGLGFQLRQDLLASLGDTWRVYAPGDGGVISGWTLACKLRDPNRLAAVHAKLLASVPAGPMGPLVQSSSFGDVQLNSLHVPADDFLALPTWCIAGDELVVGAFPQAVREHISRRGQTRSLADRADVAAKLKGKPVYVVYQDTPKLLRMIYPLAQVGVHLATYRARRTGMNIDVSVLPTVESIARHLAPAVATMRRTELGYEFESHSSLPGSNLVTAAPVTAALLLPAIQSARGAAQRAQAANNLRQIGLAMHNFHDTYRAFPASHSADADNKPLLSWRVHILPFIGEQQLYSEFKLDEPWDSEHNKPLIARMPATLRSPNSTAEPGKTTYLGVKGEHMVFVDPQAGSNRGTGLAKILDGTSNTVMVVEASDERAVVWTKPDDFEPPEDNPMKGLVGLHPGGFQALLGDGSVRFISAQIDKNVLKLLFTMDDGQPVPNF